MSTFRTSATASHRYYKRKSKDEIRRRIRDMLVSIDEDALAKAMVKTSEEEAKAAVQDRRPYNATWPITWLWFEKIGVPDALDRWSKDELATMAMKAHDFLAEPAP